jgi:hypothetical protein
VHYHVEHGHFEQTGQWVTDYPALHFDAADFASAKQFVERQIKVGAFEDWKGGCRLRIWSEEPSEVATCSFKGGFDSDWS